MFVCYLDDSDAEHSSVVTIAGYVARLESWKAFEMDAKKVYDSYGVTVLHTKELHSTKGEFAGWSRIKKHTFISELYDIAAQHVSFGISVSLSKKAHKKLQKKNKGLAGMSPYGACFAGVLSKVCYRHAMSDEIRREGISFMVESGHKNNPGLEKHFHRVRNFKIFKGILHSVKFIEKDSCVAVQISDFNAMHSRRIGSNTARLGGKFIFPMVEIFDIAKRKLEQYAIVGHGEGRIAQASEVFGEEWESVDRKSA